MNKFTNEVSEKLKYYIYRLIDPRNGLTFYVGKGKGNRVFDHVNGALKEDPINESTLALKNKIINDINNDGLEVIHIIQRWGIDTEEEAYLVESAIIDCYAGLTNIQCGYQSDFGVTNSKSLQHNLSTITYNEPKNLPYIIIKITEESLAQNEDNLYETTRYSWKLNLENAQKNKYVLSVMNGIVKQVYEVEKWYLVPNTHRIAFEGKIAAKTISDHFINKRIPEIYLKKGASNPALYSKN